ncbi:MAG: HD domain-containing protein [Planctomycetota bacterium]|jgi:ribosomal protein S27E
MPRCPGQDQRFWKPDDIFEVECPVCEFSVEFWKDEPQVKCPSCKQLIVNPKLDLGCAKWCKHAEECLGQIAGQEKSNLSTRLIESLRQIAEADQSVVRSSLEVLRYAEKIQLEEGGEPLVVKASAILSHIYEVPTQPELETQTDNAAESLDLLIHNILEKQGIKKEFRDHVCRILTACRDDKSMDSLEFKIIWDACRLAQLGQHTSTPDGTETDIAWKTETGRILAKERFEN